MGKTNPKYFKTIQNYNKEHYKRLTLRFRTDDPKDMELYNLLISQESINSFIKDILFEKINK